MRNLLSDLFYGLVRTLGFFTKELAGLLRQPRLIFSFILGPFLILLLFGLGFQGQQPEFATTLVVPNDPAISDQASDYREGFTGVFKLQEVTRDEQRARDQLEAGDTDVVIVVPANAIEQIYAGQQAKLTVLYQETDPTQSAWVRYFAYVQTSELNRKILAEVVRQSKGPAAQALEYAAETRAETDALASDVRSGRDVDAAARTARLIASTRAARTGIGAGLDAISSAGSSPVAGSLGYADSLLAGIEQELIYLQSDLVMGPAGADSAQRRVQLIQRHTDQFAQMAERVNRIPPETLVSPFTANAENVVPVEPTPIGFYTPAVLALLLQHIGVTLAALSSVRDRLLGSQELFRVSPVGTGNILIGKSLSYALLLAIVAGALSVAATYFLGVPSLGDPTLFALVIALTIFASVALGFALSIFAKTESQAVQLSMLALLTSVFFGGFFLPLEQLFPWVRVVSFVLPVTYGSIDLRDVMLRGTQPGLLYLLGPLLLGIVFYALAAFGIDRQMRRA